MAYLDHFKHADDVITELNNYVPLLTDPLVKIKYVGFVAIVSITVYELAVKDIFIQFSKIKNKTFGTFVEKYFDRINGKIKINIIQDDYIKKFGDKYVNKFKNILKKESINYLKLNRRDFQSSYSNLITWRNDFAHEGKINQNATYDEAVQAYEDGKQVLHCLAKCMVR